MGAGVRERRGAAGGGVCGGGVGVGLGEREEERGVKQLVGEVWEAAEQGNAKSEGPELQLHAVECERRADVRGRGSGWRGGGAELQHFRAKGGEPLEEHLGRA